eukprot:67967_1
MASLLKRNVPHIAVAGALYDGLRMAKVPNSLSLFIPSCGFVYFADKNDLEVFISLTLTPVIGQTIHRYGLVLPMYSLSMSYIMVNLIWDHTTVPKRFREFLDNNCGVQRSSLRQIRCECTENGWISKEWTKNMYNSKEIMMRCAKRLMVSMGKLTVFQLILGMIVSRKLKINVAQKIQNYIRTVFFLWTIFQIGLNGPVISFVIVKIHHNINHRVGKYIYFTHWPVDVEYNGNQSQNML